ncbi:hypothetical protein SLEP1_g37943 [Rubroshorea leprosula]|uniref:Uncharacterized protein n=1 Tax=Rubroshorea leprosula TaxID=152421 RepID=A0AAV5KWV1_9ROSI|nr:hypothetical protein SLEP1_g37943 [Rubroshorea leprosula]
MYLAIHAKGVFQPLTYKNSRLQRFFFTGFCKRTLQT